jgi:hypothetical protein
MAILLISDSWVARITGVNHWHLAQIYLFTWQNLLELTKQKCGSCQEKVGVPQATHAWAVSWVGH